MELTLKRKPYGGGAYFLMYGTHRVGETFRVGKEWSLQLQGVYWRSTDAGYEANTSRGGTTGVRLQSLAYALSVANTVAARIGLTT